MGLLDGGIQQLFGTVFSGLYLNGTWIVKAMVDNGKGGYTQTTTPKPMKYQQDEYSDFQKALAGIPTTDVRLLILQHGAGFTPSKDDKFTMDGVTYFRCVDFTQDPAKSYWKVHGTLTNGGV